MNLWNMAASTASFTTHSSVRHSLTQKQNIFPSPKGFVPFGLDFILPQTAICEKISSCIKKSWIF
jgi:hypothetical protein